MSNSLATSMMGIPLVRGRSTVQSCAAAPQNLNKTGTFERPRPFINVAIAQNIQRNANVQPWKIRGLVPSMFRSRP
jgi:hypothetical protein